ncbi:phosphopantothenoylcysteine decarboxylase / phosphopantothenate--cysteine ligase [Saccharopolyspora shandongensis]|uniref:Phosphopantothenoylcysteine decarboxylase / phosphopantothenate--cysteine ligase n=1 Tax=Saccharopolyspora shandongensis TaxID=418495 RepID=A0A1H2QQ48_9PSEU|nr:flavoprotein [Saccharopolyspora shandongensis]SDW09323.1 phosphopantothenoylcysteine decarboxylase / phosphopantothenate--cysteine ligase [Saccharopolyspora shandongensis]
MATNTALLCDRMLLAVTGSPALLTMPQTVLLMRQSLVRELRVMMSRSACRFLPPYTMRLFAGGWVHTETHRARDDAPIPHLDLTDGIDLMLVMPATANAIAKAAHGICDDLVSTAMVASTAPVVLVPAMNEAMWRSRAVQRNVAHARELGYSVIDPAIGVQLADRRPALGVMPPLEHILDQLIDVVTAAKERGGIATGA